MKLIEFLTPWEPSITLVMVSLVIAGAYIRGCVLLQISLTWRLSFWLGSVLIYVVLHTQFDYYSEHEFFMHRIQHSVLHHIGPFLIIISKPGKILFAGLPALNSYKRQWQPIINVLNHPAVAPIIFCGLILFWLIPSIHFIAMLDWRLYRVMNWSMLVNGLMFWSVVLGTRLRATLRIMMMLSIIPPQIAIGALIFFAPRELYELYSLCGRAFTLSPLADQQIGGLILWIPAAMMSVIGVLVVVSQEWLKKEI